MERRSRYVVTGTQMESFCIINEESTACVLSSGIPSNDSEHSPQTMFIIALSVNWIIVIDS
jgi:hypothetical protein